MSKSDHFGHHYDGRNHGQYASLIKKYTSASKRPLNPAEQSQLIRLLQNFTVTQSWNWRSLTTTLYSFTSAGVFTPHKPMGERVKLTQAALLSKLLDATIFKCNQKPQAWDIDAQGIANLLWVMAKLVDSGKEWPPGLKEAVAELLTQVNIQKDQFNAQAIANLLWAMAKLVDNGQERTPELNEAIAVLLSHVNAQKTHLKPQEIANLLWAMAKLGEFVELNMATSTFESLVYQISYNPQFTHHAILMSLWGVMVCCARLSLDSNTNRNHVLEKHMDDLFTRLENISPVNEEDQSILAMAACWLGKPCPVTPYYQTTTSKYQTIFRNQLQSRIPSLKIEEEKSLHSLPPVDLLLPDHNIIIEVQGPSHYVSGDFKTRNGSTLLKIALLRKSGFEVIEIPVNEFWNKGLMNRCIDQIKTRVDTPAQDHGAVSFNIGWTEEAKVTANKGWQFSDHSYLTAEEHSEQQTRKPKRKRKRKRR
ncbi:RAP domain-containing protein [Salinisphaera sp. G21_0]|uniref:RAP domain-containing protein n=1 Tax=Salinisphaera sp. G21_0 TaxID=2821094 RepID=UPI001ADD0297|nr:RAP domain-containing protein [Salinisphaera sp. G21_0]